MDERQADKITNLLARIDERTNNLSKWVKSNEEFVCKRLESLERRIESLERWRWLTVGAASAAGAGAANLLLQGNNIF